MHPKSVYIRLIHIHNYNKYDDVLKVGNFFFLECTNESIVILMGESSNLRMDIIKGNPSQLKISTVVGSYYRYLTGVSLVEFPLEIKTR